MDNRDSNFNYKEIIEMLETEEVIITYSETNIIEAKIYANDICGFNVDKPLHLLETKEAKKFWNKLGIGCKTKKILSFRPYNHELSISSQAKIDEALGWLYNKGYITNGSIRLSHMPKDEASGSEAPKEVETSRNKFKEELFQALNKDSDLKILKSKYAELYSNIYSLDRSNNLDSDDDEIQFY